MCFMKNSLHGFSKLFLHKNELNFDYLWAYWSILNSWTQTYLKDFNLLQLLS